MAQIRRHTLSAGNDKGFTLVELIVTIAVLAIIAVVLAGILVTFMRIFLYLPREMKAKTIAHDISELSIEGEPNKPGMRYAASLTNATTTTITYISGYPTSADQVTMTFTYDTINDRVQRTVGASAAETIPYYDTPEISVACPSDVFFKYYDSSGNQIANPNTQALRNTIRRVEMTYTVMTGTGNFNSAQSSYITTSGVDIKQYV